MVYINCIHSLGVERGVPVAELPLYIAIRGKWVPTVRNCTRDFEYEVKIVETGGPYGTDLTLSEDENDIRLSVVRVRLASPLGTLRGAFEEVMRSEEYTKDERRRRLRILINMLKECLETEIHDTPDVEALIPDFNLYTYDDADWQEQYQLDSSIFISMAISYYHAAIRALKDELEGTANKADKSKALHDHLFTRDRSEPLPDPGEYAFCD